MSTVLEAPEMAAVEHDRTAFNLAVWDKLVADPELAKLPYRVETDQHGQMIMSPPPAPSHGNKQSRLSRLLGNLLTEGQTICECPISTRLGVKAADVAWCSDEVWRESEGKSCLLRAPEICIEILSPSNTKSEIEEKKSLYFEGGAREFWLCDEAGSMRFFSPGGQLPASALAPEFPAIVG